MKLTGNDKMKSEGAWVFTDQGVAKEKGFRNVSRTWLENGTISYEEGLELLEEGRSQTEDIICPVSEMQPTVSDDGRFVLRSADGRDFEPTEYATSQMGSWAGCGSWFVGNMMHPPVDHKGRPKYQRDRGDAEVLAHVFQNGFRRIEPSKRFLFRTRKDGELRAMLSTEYAPVDNRWFIETYSKVLPGGRLSHWKGDQDTLFGNILIPDTIRAEDDSDYGGMVSVGNSEIGERKVSSLPSIFRAICQNGCVWGQKTGFGISVVHRGKLDINALYLEIQANIDRQIPLATTAIDRLLGKRDCVWSGKSVLPLLAEVASEFGLGRKLADSLLDAYDQEKSAAPETANTLFGLVATITRAGQMHDRETWVKLDEVGGILSEYFPDDWDDLTRRARSMNAKKVEKMFPQAV